MTEIKKTEEFQAFPAEKVQQMEVRQKATASYRSPHLPKPAATGLVTESAPIPVVVAQVPIEIPGFTKPTSEVEAVVLDLPSRYCFYDFKDLYVKPFKGLHLGKLSRAREERSILHTVEAVSSVLSNTNGDTHIAFKLTLPDFYFVLYWLRINSFTKSNFVHESYCTNEEHITQVTEGTLPRDTLKQASVINKSTMITNMLNEMPNPEAFVLDYPGITLAPTNMQDAIELTEDPLFVNEEFRYAAKQAVYIRGAEPMTLRQRISIVEDMSPDDILVIEAYDRATGEYGIVEQINVTCKTCGHSKVDKIHLDAHSFFPAAR